ncbi:T9SS type A sorting domain-containing protein [Labilibaculum sp. DW002]|uniref:T9SS type A sorting domain-containing protein n=1 Tax=Paralabilibaculum antarcticum TaxID=2912572 RepID=A0ABT5VSP9_9BACT|nr:T9SS type A sorting domain-containing protein [Labilibaculum sp. DW002]MDE5418450.1 T9SS type A sorting domain-containing protein [Labilibaculum sp. DW002]
MINFPKLCFKILSILILIVNLHIVASAQSVQLKSTEEIISLNNLNQLGAYRATLGADIVHLSNMHGITYKLSFDPNVVYADSMRISANEKQLELNKDDYYEIQRIDSSFILYSLTLKGRDKSLKLDELPISIDFVIKPETYYKLISNNCKYEIEFKAESITAYDNNKSEIPLSPFVLPINIECEDHGEPNLLLAAPNPTKERCWIHIQPEKIETIEFMLLYDTKGSQYDSKPKLLGDQIELNLSHLKPGQYFFNIIYSNQQKDIVKIIKV